jgi:hypothetical protein
MTSARTKLVHKGPVLSEGRQVPVSKVITHLFVDVIYLYLCPLFLVVIAPLVGHERLAEVSKKNLMEENKTMKDS